MKHTPGPWVAIGSWVEHPDDHTADICTCATADINQSRLGRSYEEECANACLIAAAPDLRVALQRLVEHDEYMIEMGTLHSFIEVEEARALLDSLPDEAME